MDTIITLRRPAAEAGGLRAMAALSLRALFEPGRFFRHELPSFSLPEALVFGLGNAWLASVLAFFVQTFNSLLLARFLERWMQKLLDAEGGLEFFSVTPDSFLWTSGALLLAPFLFLLRGLFSASVLFLFSRLLIEERPGAPEPVSYTGALRIQAAVLCSRWFGLVPVFGAFLVFIVGFALTVTGVKERFGVSSRRALAVVTAPYLMLLFVLLAFGTLALLALSQLSLQDLLEIDARQLPLDF